MKWNWPARIRVACQRGCRSVGHTSHIAVWRASELTIWKLIGSFNTSAFVGTNPTGWLIPGCPWLAHNATNTSHKPKKVETRHTDQRYLFGAPQGPWPFNRRLGIRKVRPTARSIRSGLTWLDRQCPLVRRSILPTYLKRKIRQFDLVLRAWTHPLDHSIWHQVGPPTVHRRCKVVRDRSHGAQQSSQSPRPAPD
jgi:hypothetical protein